MKWRWLCCSVALVHFHWLFAHHWRLINYFQEIDFQMDRTWWLPVQRQKFDCQCCPSNLNGFLLQHFPINLSRTPVSAIGFGEEVQSIRSIWKTIVISLHWYLGGLSSRAQWETCAQDFVALAPVLFLASSSHRFLASSSSLLLIGECEAKKTTLVNNGWVQGVGGNILTRLKTWRKDIQFSMKQERFTGAN